MMQHHRSIETTIDIELIFRRWAHTIRVFTLNSGLFYASANNRTIALMDRITARLAKEKAWDQARTRLMPILCCLCVVVVLRLCQQPRHCING